ncbi:MAG TPA: MAPEG family protein [Myxococcaceae bacterium]|nr:MAPEG family protein [Myxococcaceae bacterium]
MAMHLPLTALYAPLNGFLYLALTFHTSRLRNRHRVFVGDGGVPELQRALRASLNHGAYLPLALILMVVLELSGVPRPMLHALGGGMLLARAVYALGALRELQPAIQVGAAATYLVLAAEGACALVFAGSV